MPPSRRPWWALPLTCVLLGAVIALLLVVDGDEEGAALSLGLMACVGAVLALGGRSETVRLIRRPDERWSMIDLRATALAGHAVMTAVVVLFFVRLLRGGDVTPYTQLVLIGAVAYVAGLAWHRSRS